MLPFAVLTLMMVIDQLKTISVFDESVGSCGSPSFVSRRLACRLCAHIPERLG